MKRPYENFPESPGVYLMRGASGKILYIGKAGNLKRRVSSYFLRPLEARLHKMIQTVKKIDYQKTDTALEALILESRLIKKHRPPYNVLAKDDKSFPFIEITKEEFPRVLVVRGKDLKRGTTYYGPFVEAGQLKEALRLIRKIFPYHTHPPEKIALSEEARHPFGAPIEEGTLPRSGSPVRKKNAAPPSRGCFDWQIGLCPGTCVGAINKQEYAKTIRNIKLIFEGKKQRLIKTLEKEMKVAAAREEYEIAEKKKTEQVLFSNSAFNIVNGLQKVSSRAADGLGR